MSIFSMLSRYRSMRRIRRGICLIVACVFLTGCLPFQSAPPAGAIEVLTAMQKADPQAPDGVVRVRSALAAAPDLTSPTYLRDDLFSALYGSDCLSWFSPTVLSDGSVCSPLIDDVAVYLSTVQHPFELAVFRCTDSAGAVAAAKQCQQRLNTVRQTWRGSDEEVLCARGRVEIVGTYVLLVIASDPEAVLEAAQRAIS